MLVGFPSQIQITATSLLASGRMSTHKNICLASVVELVQPLYDYVKFPRWRLWWTFSNFPGESETC